MRERFFAHKTLCVALWLIASCSDSTAPPKPASLALQVPAPASAEVGSAITTLAIVVRDERGNVMADQPITVAASAGSTFNSALVRTLAGPTPLGTWTLGGTVGPNVLTVTAGSLPPLIITVQGTAGPPANITVQQGAGQNALAGTALSVPIAVSVTDRFGNPTAATTVSFRVTGGGSLAGSVDVMTNAAGFATAPMWILGKRNVPQQMSVTVGNLTEHIGATIRTSMRISLRFFGEMTDAQKAIFQGAADRLTAAITAGGPPVQAISYPVGEACGIPAYQPLTELIDGIIIYASIAPIDGPDQTLAQAGPCAFRSSAPYLPVIARIVFDVADLQNLANGGSLEDVATHEMMHSLGFGTMWQQSNLVFGTSTTDPRYAGVFGLNGCRLLGATLTCSQSIPVANVGGPGTINSHWRESVFVNELMTGNLNPGANPFSTMSIQSMVDLGYAVNTAVADSYIFAAGLRATSPAIVREGWEKLSKLPADAEQLESVGGLLRPRF